MLCNGRALDIIDNNLMKRLIANAEQLGDYDSDMIHVDLMEYRDKLFEYAREIVQEALGLSSDPFVTTYEEKMKEHKYWTGLELYYIGLQIIRSLEKKGAQYEWAGKFLREYQEIVAAQPQGVERFQAAFKEALRGMLFSTNKGIRKGASWIIMKAFLGKVAIPASDPAYRELMKGVDGNEGKLTVLDILDSLEHAGEIIDGFVDGLGQDEEKINWVKVQLFSALAIEQQGSNPYKRAAYMIKKRGWEKPTDEAHAKAVEAKDIGSPIRKTAEPTEFFMGEALPTGRMADKKQAESIIRRILEGKVSEGKVSKEFIEFMLALRPWPVNIRGGVVWFRNVIRMQRRAEEILLLSQVVKELGAGERALLIYNAYRQGELSVSTVIYVGKGKLEGNRMRDIGEGNNVIHFDRPYQYPRSIEGIEDSELDIKAEAAGLKGYTVQGVIFTKRERETGLEENELAGLMEGFKADDAKVKIFTLGDNGQLVVVHDPAEFEEGLPIFTVPAFEGVAGRMPTLSFIPAGYKTFGESVQALSDVLARFSGLLNGSDKVNMDKPVSLRALLNLMTRAIDETVGGEGVFIGMDMEADQLRSREGMYYLGEDASRFGSEARDGFIRPQLLTEYYGLLATDFPRLLVIERAFAQDEHEAWEAIGHVHALETVSFGFDSRFVALPSNREEVERLLDMEKNLADAGKTAPFAGTAILRQPQTAADLRVVRETLKAAIKQASLRSSTAQAAYPPGSLRSSLTYEPVHTSMGTSGFRGLSDNMRDFEPYAIAGGFVRWLKKKGQIKFNEAGKIVDGQEVALARDHRNSSPDFAAAVIRALNVMGLGIDYLGTEATPVLAFWSQRKKIPGIMITGSHTAGKMNGLKLYDVDGEVLNEPEAWNNETKADREEIIASVQEERERLYRESAEESDFTSNGYLKEGLKPQMGWWDEHVNSQAGEAFVNRYLEAFPDKPYEGCVLAYWVHSSVGARRHVQIYEGLGAKVIQVGARGKDFIALDTEDMTRDHLKFLADTAAEIRREYDAQEDASGRVIVTIEGKKYIFLGVRSSDGDSDRPLVVDEKGRFWRGDVLGAIYARFLKLEHFVQPLTGSEDVPTYLKKYGIEFISTSVGSPYVVHRIRRMLNENSQLRIGANEVNGGGFIGPNIVLPNSKPIDLLVTRDAMIVKMAVDLMALNYHGINGEERAVGVFDLFEGKLDRYCSSAGIIHEMPVPPGTKRTGLRLLDQYAPKADLKIAGASFDDAVDQVTVAYRDSRVPQIFAYDSPEGKVLVGLREEMQRFFSKERGFTEITRMHYGDRVDDGVMMWDSTSRFHVRPSGNAPETRIYVYAPTQERADEIMHMATHDPDGILRQIERSVWSPQEVLEWLAARAGKDSSGNYPANMPSSNGSDRTPTVDEQAKIFKALGGQDVGVFQGRDVVVMISPSLKAPVRTEDRNGQLYLLVNPNIYRGPPEQLEVIFRGHELFHIFDQSETQARKSTTQFLIENNLLESHIAFLQDNDLGLVPDADWLDQLYIAQQGHTAYRTQEDALQSMLENIPCDSNSSGNKGAMLRRMIDLGLPVPPGFRISVEQLRRGEISSGFLSARITLLEKKVSRKWGDAQNPLRVVVRSSPQYSMPGILETVSNVTTDEELIASITKVKDSWNTEAARAYRVGRNIPEELGLAVIVQVMIRGDLNGRSASGVLFTQDPITGEDALSGRFAPQAQGHEIVSRTAIVTGKINDGEGRFGRIFPESYEQMEGIKAVLEKEFKAVQEVEFVIEDGVLWLVQTRNAVLTPRARSKAAITLFRKGVLSKFEMMALFEMVSKKVTYKAGDFESQGYFVSFSDRSSPGAVAGPVVFSLQRAHEFMQKGTPAILVALERSKEIQMAILNGEIGGIITSFGHEALHEAILARAQGIPMADGRWTAHLPDCGFYAVPVLKDGALELLNETGQFMDMDSQRVQEGDEIVLAIKDYAGRIWRKDSAPRLVEDRVVSIVGIDFDYDKEELALKEEFEKYPYDQLLTLHMDFIIGLRDSNEITQESLKMNLAAHVIHQLINQMGAQQGKAQSEIDADVVTTFRNRFMTRHLYYYVLEDPNFARSLGIVGAPINETGFELHFLPYNVEAVGVPFEEEKRAIMARDQFVEMIKEAGIFDYTNIHLIGFSKWDPMPHGHGSYYTCYDLGVKIVLGNVAQAERIRAVNECIARVKKFQEGKLGVQAPEIMKQIHAAERAGKDSSGNYPANMPSSNGSDRTPTVDEQAKIFKALGGQDVGVFQGRDVVVMISPSLKAPVRTEDRNGQLYLLVNPNIYRGPPEQLEVIFRGHELFHIFDQSETQARKSTTQFLIENNLLESHIAFLQDNDLGLVPDADWLDQLYIAQQVHTSSHEINTARESGIIVEIDARALARTYGTISHVPSEFWDFVAKLGTSIIWLKCPWQESPLSFDLMQKYSRLHKEALPGENPVRMASGYDVFKYELNPDVAESDEEFVSVVKRLREMGMALILDFVTNHIAADSPYITEVPGLVRSGNRKWVVSQARRFFPDEFKDASDEEVILRSLNKQYPSFSKIKEGFFIQHARMDADSKGAENLAQINYLDERARRFMIDVVLDKIARLTQNGGLRADLAYLAFRLTIRDFWGFGIPWSEFERLMPKEFWQELKERVDERYPGMSLFAETYGQGNIETFVSLGFNPYNKIPYDLLVAGDIAKLRAYLLRATPDQMKQWSSFLANCINCTEDHDEPAAPEAFRDREHMLAASVILWSIPGFELIPLRQIFGMGKPEGAVLEMKSADGGIYPFQYPDVTKAPDAVVSEIPDIMHFISLPVMRQGGMDHAPVQEIKLGGNVVGVSQTGLVAFTRNTPSEHALVLVNDSWEQKVEISVARSGRDVLKAQCLSQGVNVQIMEKEIKVILSPWQYCLLAFGQEESRRDSPLALSDTRTVGDPALPREGKTVAEVVTRRQEIEANGFKAEGFIRTRQDQDGVKRVFKWLEREHPLLYPKLRVLRKQLEIWVGEDRKEIFLGANGIFKTKRRILIATNIPDNISFEEILVHEIIAVLTGDHEFALRMQAAYAKFRDQLLQKEERLRQERLLEDYCTLLASYENQLVVLMSKRMKAKVEPVSQEENGQLVMAPMGAYSKSNIYLGKLRWFMHKCESAGFTDEAGQLINDILPKIKDAMEWVTARKEPAAQKILNGISLQMTACLENLYRQNREGREDKRAPRLKWNEFLSYLETVVYELKERYRIQNAQKKLQGTIDMMEGRLDVEGRVEFTPIFSDDELLQETGRFMHVRSSLTPAGQESPIMKKERARGIMDNACEGLKVSQRHTRTWKSKLEAAIKDLNDREKQAVAIIDSIAGIDPQSSKQPRQKRGVRPVSARKPVAKVMGEINNRSNTFLVSVKLILWNVDNNHFDEARDQFTALIRFAGQLEGILSEPEYSGTQLIIDKAKRSLDVGNKEGFRQMIKALEDKIERAIEIHHLAEQYVRTLIAQTLSSDAEVNEDKAFKHVFDASSYCEKDPSMSRLFWPRLYRLLRVPLSVGEGKNKKDNPAGLAIDELIKRMKSKSQQLPAVALSTEYMESLIVDLVNGFGLKDTDVQVLRRAAQIPQPTAKSIVVPSVPAAPAMLPGALLCLPSTYVIGYPLFWFLRIITLGGFKTGEESIRRWIQLYAAPFIEARKFEKLSVEQLMFLHRNLPGGPQRRLTGILKIKRAIADGYRDGGWTVAFVNNVLAHYQYNLENPNDVLTFGARGRSTTFATLSRASAKTADKDSEKKSEEKRDRIIIALIIALLLLALLMFFLCRIFMWPFCLCGGALKMKCLRIIQCRWWRFYSASICPMRRLFCRAWQFCFKGITWCFYAWYHCWSLLENTPCNGTIFNPEPMWLFLYIVLCPWLFFNWLYYRWTHHAVRTIYITVYKVVITAGERHFMLGIRTLLGGNTNSPGFWTGFNNLIAPVISACTYNISYTSTTYAYTIIV